MGYRVASQFEKRVPILILNAGLVLALSLGSGCAPRAPQQVEPRVMELSTETTLREQLALLDDPTASSAAKLAASSSLVAAGKAAIPLLVERLQNPEDRLYLDAVRVPTGPMSPPAVMPVQVRFHVESLLYQIVCPPERTTTPTPTVADGASAESTAGVPALDHAALGVQQLKTTPELRLVDDWSAWWQDHHGKSLEKIRGWFRDELNRRRNRLHMQTTAPPR